LFEDRTSNYTYYLVFFGWPKRKAILQHIKIRTETANSEIAALDDVWVPGLKDNDKNK
jgi:hypothetical protein